MKTPSPRIALALAAFAVATLPVHGAVVEIGINSTLSQGIYNADVSATDLINVGQPSVASYASSLGSNADVGTTFSGIYNGSAVNNDLSANGSLTYLGSTQFGTSLNSVPVLTVNFNLDDGTGGSSLGYTLTSIQSIYGWTDWASMSNQNFEILISTDLAQLAFTSLHMVGYNPFDPADDLGSNQPNTSMVTLTNLNAVGVTAVQFVFSPYNNGDINQAGQLIREIDVFGSATVVPEPSTYGLLVGAGVFLLAVRRSRGNKSVKQS